MPFFTNYSGLATEIKTAGGLYKQKKKTTLPSSDAFISATRYFYLQLVKKGFPIAVKVFRELVFTGCLAEAETLYCLPI